MNTEWIEVLRGRALVVGGVARITEDIPVGEAWYEMVLGINHVVVIGTGAGPRAEGGLRPILGVTLKTSKGERIIDGVPGRPLYRWDQMKSRTAALLAAIAAADGTYRVLLRCHFYDPLAKFPMDTILDTSRYSGLTLEIQYGVIGDLYTAPGTATVAPTLDLYVRRLQGRLADNVKPLFRKEYGVREPINLANVTEINLERAQNLTYERLMLYTTENGAAGVPFSGDVDVDAISEFTIDHDKGQPFQDVLIRINEAMNKQDYGLEAEVDAQQIIDFEREGSKQQGMLSGDKSRLRVLVTNDVAGAGTRLCSLAYEGLRPLVP